MNPTLKSFLGIFMIALVFGFGYISYNHIDNSYMMNEPDHVVELEAANDSLENVISDLEEQNAELTEELDELTSESEEETTDEK
jgi:hypothetical protein